MNGSHEDVNSCWVSFDFETTGLDPSSDRVVEVGAVAFSSPEGPGRPGGAVEIDTFTSLANPGRPCHPRATAAHGLTDAMLADQRDVREIIHEFVYWLRRHNPAALIAHNAAFDCSFFHAELARIGFLPPEYPVECTLALARRKLPGLQSHRLEAVAGHLGLGLEDGHRALADARRAMGIWAALGQGGGADCGPSTGKPIVVDGRPDMKWEV